MGLIKGFQKFRGGWPGGWRRYAMGSPRREPPSFVQPRNPDDRRSLIPPFGFREYWYPALPARAIKWRKPVGLRICGIDIVLFRDHGGTVRALSNICPHRGAWLSWGDCFWKGFISCPYHGATFDGDGNCVEFITEGPDSKMVGRLKARAFPTRTLKGMVFVWMGEDAEHPVAIEEDVPPEFFEGRESVVRHTVRYWRCNWMISLENFFDSHNFFWVHRNSIWVGMNRYGGRPRTPIGYRARIINNKTVQVVSGANEYYAVNGTIPLQMYYPRVRGWWPKTPLRWTWLWLTERILRIKFLWPKFETPTEWDGTRLPGMQRLSTWNGFYTRWSVPVEDQLTRVFYFRSVRPVNRLDRFARWVAWPFYNFVVHYNFSDQDYDAMQTLSYESPEFLSSTDSYLVMLRKLFTTHARGLKRTVEVAEQTTAEKLQAEADRGFGVEQRSDQAAGANERVGGSVSLEAHRSGIGNGSRRTSTPK